MIEKIAREAKAKESKASNLVKNGIERSTNKNLHDADEDDFLVINFYNDIGIRDTNKEIDSSWASDPGKSMSKIDGSIRKIFDISNRLSAYGQRQKRISKVVEKSLLVSKKLIFATYNVRSLTKYKQYQLIPGCTLQNIDLVAIQEHQQGLSTDIDYQMVPTGTIVRISAKENGLGGKAIYREGTACNLVFTIVACYAPTEAATKEEKD
ncbi:hypothetical protein BpHYR1_052006 [Brachionus plicatilis]|uniref:Uncharacterized protein n=1 Tax=Brachionus plicatilis TaxID=10195 RepID=A0A3M7SC09_BRAPC|nr:hypothetical protein BpHYR1_052006 [Brachionus plicatilis]